MTDQVLKEDFNFKLKVLEKNLLVILQELNKRIKKLERE